VTRDVVFRPQAETELIALYEYIAGKAGPDVAGNYVGRLEAACMALADFPERGTPRNDILPGLRTTSFERRVTIAYHVLATRVEIVSIAYAGRDFESALRRDK
jgi:toxin ParE1/3/4